MKLHTLLGTALLNTLVIGGWAQENLPVTRVVLFRSGVGYIERTGTVSGNTSLMLSLREPQMNDLLKSLVLIDFDGGRVEPVQYTPRDPLARTLESYAINLGDNPARHTLLSRLRGVSVEVQARQSPSLATLKGSVLSVESHTVKQSDNPEARTEYYLNLMTPEGIRTVPLSDVVNFRVLDERLQKELEGALSALASGLDTTRKSVELRFAGSGRRQVLVGYLTEMPLWKMTYRLVIPEQGKPLLQGWAIVENTTDEDWRNVQVTLVSGRPISFIQNLYEPIYLKRPVYRPPLEDLLRPFQPQAEMLVQPDIGAPRERRVMAPDVAGRGVGAPAAPPTLEKGFEEMQQSVIEMARGQEAGALFEYRIQMPVTILRQRSAMLPVITQQVEAEPVSLYNPRQHPIHPLFGVRLRNTTELTLMEGSVTVYYGGSYGGDALMDTVEPDGERVLTYALDGAVEVSPDVQQMRQDVLTLKVVRGVLEQQVKQQRVSKYTLRNRARESRTLLIEHPYDAAWTLVQPARADRTRDFYRFKLTLAPDKSETLEVMEERTVSQTYALLDADTTTLQVFLRDVKASEALRKALQEIINRRNQIAQLNAERTREQNRIQGITQDQERIRQNMAQLDRASDLYKQYVQKLTQQEREIEEARARIERLQKQIDEAQQALVQYIQNLTL